MVDYLKYLIGLIKNFFNPPNDTRGLSVIKVDERGRQYVVRMDNHEHLKERRKLELRTNDETFLDRIKSIFRKIIMGPEDRSKRR